MTDLTLSYIQTQIRPEALKHLLDLNITDTILDTNPILVETINRAESEFYSYMSVYYTFPLVVTDTTNQALIEGSVLSLKYAIFQYYLFGRVHDNEELAQVLAEYERVISLLKQYSNGTKVFSGLETNVDLASTSGLSIKSNKTSSDKIFTDLSW